MPMPRLVLIILLLVFSTPITAADNVVVVGLFKDKALLKIDGTQRLLKAGETSPEGVKLIAADSQEAEIEINGKKATYTLGTHINSSFKAPGAGVLVRLWPNPANGLYMANGSINGFDMDFVVDTGATYISMNSNQARRLGINYRLDGREGLSQTASGTSKIYVIELGSVKVGAIELKNVTAAVHEGDYPVHVLLGNSFLERITLRRKGKMLELEGPS